MNDTNDKDLEQGDDALRGLHKQSQAQISSEHHQQILNSIDAAVAQHAPQAKPAGRSKWSQRAVAPIALAAGIILGVAVTINTGPGIPSLNSPEGEAIFLDMERSRDPSAPRVPLSIKEWKELTAERQREFITSLIKQGKTREAEILLHDHRRQYGDESTIRDI
jgi:hypothetical protein